MKVRIICIANQKGGVGKTSTVQNTAKALSLGNRKVLMVDLDPQANLTEGSGLVPADLEYTMFDVLVDKLPITTIIQKIGTNLDIAPSNIDLSGAEVHLLTMVGKDLRLRKCLEPVLDKYDYIVIDCPPNLGQLTLNGLHGAKEIIIPMQTEYYAYKAIPNLLNTIEVVVDSGGNPDLKITGIVATRYDARKKLNRLILSQIQEQFTDKVFKTTIRENISVAEAPAAGESIHEYESESKGADDYTRLSIEIMAQEALYGR